MPPWDRSCRGDEAAFDLVVPIRHIRLVAERACRAAECGAEIPSEVWMEHRLAVLEARERGRLSTRLWDADG